MFEIGFLGSKSVKEMGNNKLGDKKPVLEQKGMDSKHFFISICKWLLILAMLSTKR